MTAISLAVAIPAVYAYNAFNRRNRIWLAKLDAFAHDLFVMLTMKNAEEKSKSKHISDYKSVGDVS